LTSSPLLTGEACVHTVPDFLDLIDLEGLFCLRGDDLAAVQLGEA